MDGSANCRDRTAVSAFGARRRRSGGRRSTPGGAGRRDAGRPATMKMALFLPGCHRYSMRKPAPVMLRSSSAVVNARTIGSRPSIRPSGATSTTRRRIPSMQAVLVTKTPPGRSMRYARAMTASRSSTRCRKSSARIASNEPSGASGMAEAMPVRASVTPCAAIGTRVTAAFPNPKDARGSTGMIWPTQGDPTLPNGKIWLGRRLLDGKSR